MLRVGLLSDTHGFLDEKIFVHFKDCHELWHAGDFGDMSLIERLQAFKPLRGVYGNIDSQAIRNIFPEVNIFTCEGVRVMMKHIGGYPPNYNKETKRQLTVEKPQLFISGHSHILKIIYNERLQCLHMNPGACGRQGWHKVRTLIRFTIDGNDIRDCDVIELGKK
jgi:putative phosphoesterase